MYFQNIFLFDAFSAYLPLIVNAKDISDDLVVLIL